MRHPRLRSLRQVPALNENGSRPAFLDIAQLPEELTFCVSS